MYGALAMGFCHFVVGGVLSSGEYVPGGVDGNLNVLIRVTGSKAHTVIAFSYLLIIVYAMTLAPVAWVYAAEVWSLETRAVGMVPSTADQRFSIHDYANIYPTEYSSDRELAI
jgi:sugar transport protein